MDGETPRATQAPNRRSWWPLAKWSLFALLVAFVGRRAWELWQRDRAAIEQIDWNLGWLVAAGAAYAAGWLPSVWFWRTLMRRLGGRLDFLDTARAYYCGHLGKYVPGKATVIVIRAALVRHSGFRTAPAALTVTCETLVMMGAGAAVAAALSPLLVDPSRLTGLSPSVRNGLGWVFDRPFVAPIVVLVVTVAALPVLSKLFTAVARKMTPRDMLGEEDAVTIETGLLGSGLLAFALAWALHGLSLGCTLAAVGTPFALEEWPVWTGAVSAATVLGFVAIFAPGGVGIREWVLMETLRIQGGIATQQAVAAAVFLRAVWFTTEIVAAAGLYYLVRPDPVTEPAADDKVET